MNNKKVYISLFAASLSIGVLAQETKPKQELGTEVVNVVRGYEATISDAFKINEVPTADIENTDSKKEVIYSINSFPVASTFIPEKGEAAAVEKVSRLKAFNNYVLGGFGNYTNILGEVFLSQKIDKNSYIAGFAKHFSSQGGINDLLLDDAFSKTEANIFYGGQLKNFGWTAELGGSYQLSNWYGLPMDDYKFDRGNISGIDEKQHYKDIYVNTNLEFRNSPFTNLNIHFDHFWDDYSSVENRFSIKPKVKTRIGYEADAQLGVVVDYVSTEYKDFESNYKSEYKNLNIGAEPSVVFNNEDYSLQVGLGVYYNDGKALGKSDNKFYVYPQVKASYNLVKNILVSYAGIEGGLKQNSFKEFANENPFISPDLAITPTSEKYNVYVGLRGKLDNNISFNVKGGYKNESDKATFVHSIFNLDNSLIPYGFGNSFNLEYQNVKTLNLFGEVKYEFDTNASIGVYGEWNNYDTNGTKAWNLPKFKFGADINLDFTDQWFASMNLFYVGERYDRFTAIDNSGTIILGDDHEYSKIKKVDGFVDMNLKVGYRPTKNWTVFIKGNNILNDKYDRYDNFRVQGMQIMAGAMFKFDF